MRSIDYLGAVGALMYLATFSRPDIAYDVGVLARFNAYPGLAHWNAVKHLFHYLKVLPTLLWPMLLTPLPLGCSPRSVMLTMLVARTLDALLVLMWSRWALG